MKKIFAAVTMACALWIAGHGASASDKKSLYDVPVSQLSFVVLKDYNGKPVRNAGVVMHSVGKHDKQDRGGLELKTDGEELLRGLGSLAAGPSRRSPREPQALPESEEKAR